MGIFKKKAAEERADQVSNTPAHLVTDVTKNITSKSKKGKSLKKKFGSVFRRPTDGKRKGFDPSTPNGKFVQQTYSHEVSIVSPSETYSTIDTASSNLPLQNGVDHGYEVVLEDGRNNNYEAPNYVPPRTESTKGSPACDYNDVVKGINHVQCSPLEDWNNLVEFLMVPEMKKDMKRLVFGDEETDDIDNPPVKVIHTPPCSPVPFDEMKAEDPTFFECFASGVDDEDAVTVLTNPPSLTANSVAGRRDHDRNQVGEKSSVTSVHTTSPPDATPTQSLLNRDEKAINEIDAESNPQPIHAPSQRQAPHLPLQTSHVPLPRQESSGTMPPQQSDEQIYDTAFTLRFLREVTQVGIMLEYFKVTGDGGNEDSMKSTLVTISVKPGVSRGSRLLEPRLCWKQNYPTSRNGDDGISISLLGIHSIRTSLSQDDADDDDSPFFTITTETGDVHAFESPTISERNYVVHGIKNVVAWLTYHLINGNMTSGSGVVTDLEVHSKKVEETGNLPSLKTPVQAMNDLAHSFIDE